MDRFDIYKKQLEKKLIQVSERIDGYPLRERYALLILSLMIIFLLWSFLFATPLREKRQQIAIKIAALETQVHDIKTQTNAISLQAAMPASINRLHQLAALRKEFSALEQRSYEVAKRVSKGERIPEIIKEVLAIDPDLTLVKLTNSPMISLPIKNTPRASAETQPEGLSELGLTVEFASDNYFSTLQYLERLEKLGWWFWNEIDYQVINYPSAKVTLKLHTITQPSGSS